jgi:hypothetical protein
MRLGKRSRNAKIREKLKKKRIAPSNDSSDGSHYAPSEGELDSGSESNDDASVGTPKRPQNHLEATSKEIRDTLHALMEFEALDLSDSESDGEIMLGERGTLDENDWDPEFLPDLYPIFTQPVSDKKTTFFNDITNRELTLIRVFHSRQPRES